MTTRIGWEHQAVCRSVGIDTMFEPGKAQRTNKKVCAQCPVRAECLTEALEGEHEYGIWGGLTERERRKLIRDNQHSTSWTQLVATMLQPAGRVTR